MGNTRDFRPPGPPGKGDKYLRDVAQEAARTIRSVQRNFEFETLRLAPEELSELSHILAGFAEDLHNDIGIWRTYENYNREWFGVCLPITEGSAETSARAISADRVRQSMIVKSPSIVYRYRKDLLDQAVAATERQYREFLDYHAGKDLVVYPDMSIA